MSDNISITLIRTGACCMAACLLLAAQAASAEALLPPMTGDASDFAARRAGADTAASVRISVTNEGIHAIRQAELVAAGVPASSLVGAAVRLYSRTQEVAIMVSTNGLWTTNDYLLFFGSSYDGYYSKTNIYWLGFASGGRRMTSRNGSTNAAAPVIRSATETVRYARDYWFQELYRPADATFDHWFAEALRDTATTSVTQSTDQVDSSVQATVETTLFGYTSVSNVNPDHATQVSVNGSTVGTIVYDGQSTKTGSCTFAATLLSASTVFGFREVLQAGVAADQAFLGEFTVQYARGLKARNGSLLFPGRAGTNNYAVDTFAGSSNVWILDVSDSFAPVLLTNAALTNATGGYGIVFADRLTAATTARYAVASQAGLKSVSRMDRMAFRNLSHTNVQADYIVICPYSFRQQAYRLLKYRYQQGLSIVVAPLPDIYNEFSYGIADAAAIRQFIGFAYHHWKKPAPRYVLLLGNGSYDPMRNMVGRSASDSYAAQDIIPVHLGPSSNAWTAQDAWYVQVNSNDLMPDLALGRIPVETQTNLQNVVDKILAFEQMPTNDYRRTEALLAGDRIDSGMNFKAACETIRTAYLAPNGLGVTTAYNDDLSASLVRQTMAGTYNRGVFVSFYFGHGAFDQLGINNVFNTNDVFALTNSMSPIVTMLTCQAGNFQSPTDRKSMVEAFLERKGRGAVACLASTALTQQPYCESAANGFAAALIQTRSRRIGDAFLNGCSSLFSFSPTAEDLSFIELFGDPATVVNPP